MHKILRLGAGVATLLFVVGGSAVLPSVFDTRPSCDRAGFWLAAAEDLPRDLDEFLMIPPAFRQSVFARLPAHTRSRVAREFFTRVRSDEDISSEQREALDQVVPELTPELSAEAEVTGGDRDARAVLTVLQLEDILKSAFATTTDRRKINLWTQSQVLSARFVGFRLMLGEYLRDRVFAEDGADCRCWYPGEECTATAGFECPHTPIDLEPSCTQFPACSPLAQGCGVFGFLQCTGRCITCVKVERVDR